MEEMALQLIEDMDEVELEELEEFLSAVEEKPLW